MTEINEDPLTEILKNHQSGFLFYFIFSRGVLIYAAPQLKFYYIILIIKLISSDFKDRYIKYLMYLNFGILKGIMA